MAGFRIEGNTSGNVAEVAGTNQLKIISETNVASNPNNVGAGRIFTELDSGYITTTPILISPEVDVDYRARASLDTMLDEEVFNQVTQNTGKHQQVVATMVPAWSAGQFIPNSTSITTVTTGMFLQTYACFPNIGANTLSGDVEVSFSNQPSANNFVEFGFAPTIASATVAPTDGAFFRLNSAGLQGIISINGAETSTGVFTGPGGVGTWTYTNNKRYQFILYMSAVDAKFWMNDGTGAVLLGSIALPTGNGRINLGAGVKWFMGQRITGGAGGAALQAAFNAYSVRLGGIQTASTLAQTGNRLYGSYQAQGGGANYGSLATYANSANPTAAVPTNTTAALTTGLGGQFWETCTLALNTDGIIQSYQVPAVNATIPGRRLVISGVSISSYVQTALVGNAATVGQWSLAFGHTAVSLATAETATTKAPRRVALPFTHVLTAAQAVGTDVAQAVRTITFNNPIYVNPGEFIQAVRKTVGTTQASAGTLAHLITFDYGWE
jgi:hypothetical protein